VGPAEAGVGTQAWVGESNHQEEKTRKEWVEGRGGGRRGGLAEGGAAPSDKGHARPTCTHTHVHPTLIDSLTRILTHQHSLMFTAMYTQVHTCMHTHFPFFDL
jgi:hypothetical protein